MTLSPEERQHYPAVESRPDVQDRAIQARMAAGHVEGAHSCLCDACNPEAAKAIRENAEAARLNDLYLKRGPEIVTLLRELLPALDARVTMIRQQAIDAAGTTGITGQMMAMLGDADGRAARVRNLLAEVEGK